MLKEQLFTYTKTYITLDELEALSTATTYDDFTKEVYQLESEEVIRGVKSAGKNGKAPALFYKYRIQKGKLRQSMQQEIERTRLRLHAALQLDSYYHLPPKKWNEDLPYIEKINEYLQKKGFPSEEVPAPERSLALVGDEKWIQEKDGDKLLIRLQIWNKLKIIPVHDPFSFAINPATIGNKQHLHLIVENKTTFDGLIGELTNTPFTTLIYGQGYKITKSIEHFSKQLPLSGQHIIYYFGDIDWEGIKIWHLLNEKMASLPAEPFYAAAVTKQAIPMEKKQIPNPEANEAFFAKLEQKLSIKMVETLTDNQYFPQEVLSSQELKNIWRHSDWNIP